ncbi:DUF1007 family protein [Aestuariibius sp. 2305UL40-4]|uniref:DUF1007 family protein n=1 Tax=Aestuariibius violaceus TaxID=3234132 RepID=UPI00345ED0F5
MAAVLAAGPALSHPHVFVDGGVDFVFGNDQQIEALKVTWLYDEFETLYTLSVLELSLNDAGGLDEADRLELVRRLSDWPDDFDGSAHLSIEGEPVPLAWPEGLDARMVDGRLLITFTRPLEEPVKLAGRPAEVAFYESTYFFAFSVTNPPQLIGAADPCSATVIPNDPNDQPEELRATLAALGREETPGIANVGALFADRIMVTCAS